MVVGGRVHLVDQRPDRRSGADRADAPVAM